jgi:PmbA protein
MLEGENNMNEIIEKALNIAQSSGAKNVIAKLVNGTDYQIRFSNNEIDITKQWNTHKLELFLSIGRKIDVVGIQNPSVDNLDEKITDAVENIKNKKRTLLYWGMDKKNYTNESYPTIGHLYDGEIEKFNEKAPDLINAAINSSIDNGSKKVAGVLYYGKINTGLLTSYGNGGVYDQSHFRFTIRSFCDTESSGQSIEVGRSLDNIEKRFVKAGKESGELAKLAVGGKQGVPGIYDVILSPTVGGNVFGELTRGANPIYIVGKMTCLSKSMNKQIGPSNLTISDNSLIDDGLNSRPFDFEGTPSRITPLIKKGKLVNLIQNTSSAKLWKLLGLVGIGSLKAKSTANSYLGSPIMEDFGPRVLAPMPTNIVYDPGDYSLEEMIAESKKPTIYITSNWYTRFTNYLEGKFSTIPRDGLFLIENGEIKKPVRKLRLTEDLLGMLKRISMIGKDIKQIKWWEVEEPTFIPSIKISDCKLTSSTD